MRFPRPRRTLIAALFGAVIALALPSQALAGHDLYIYKAEQQVDMVSDDQVAEVGCKSGDHVLDGMWRIDHADQDDDNLGLTSIARAVDVLEARPIDDSTYRFHFVKEAIGRAQIKIFVTCLGRRTDNDLGHTHNIDVTDYLVEHYAAWNNTELVPDWDNNPLNGVTDPCPAGYWAVTPGFEFTSPASDLIDPGFGRIYESTYNNPNMRSWKWAFQFGPTGGEVDVTIRCLRIRVDAVASGMAPPGDRHKLIARYQTDSPTFKKKRVDEGQASCGSMYKAVVSGFAINPLHVGPGLNDSSTKMWYLGMDPRIKLRALRILDSSGVARLADMATLCLNYRTT